MNTKLLLLCGLTVAAFSTHASGQVSEATMTNLQTAFNGESNAHLRYLEFAKQADREGYAGVASLFRAAALAEDIHAANHARVIRKLGGIPRAKLDTPAPGSTAQNLAAAIKGEIYERDEMYPAFVRKAESDNSPDAVQTFRFALEAEATHADLYTKAHEDQANMTSKAVFYICPVCGFTTSAGDSQECPTCSTPKEHFEQIS